MRCKLCRQLITQTGTGTWLTVGPTYDSGCPTTTGEVTGHIPAGVAS